MEMIYDYTEDGLRLPGFHWKPISKDTCIVLIHGQGGNIIENYFAHIWGKKFNDANIGFIYGHNRGYSHINDIATKDNDLRRVGATFEIFEESVYDVDLWVKKAHELGYKKIILMGHSLGCNKVIHYIYERNPKLDGVILASPPDMVGLTLLEEPNYKDLVKEAKMNVNNGEPKKLLNELLDDYSYTSSENFLNLYTEGNPIDNLPIERNPEHFTELESINVKTLAFAGSLESGPYAKIDILKDKALNCPDFTVEFIKGSGHIYKNHEEDVANTIISWLNKSN